MQGASYRKIKLQEQRADDEHVCRALAPLKPAQVSSCRGHDGAFHVDPKSSEESLKGSQCASIIHRVSKNIPLVVA